MPLNDVERHALERNLRLYPWYQAAASTMPWLPVFFLYFIQHVPLEQVVRLSAIYYLAVVVSEVPSGYISDRFGRRLTLLASALFLLLAYLCFIFASEFYALLLAEVLLAAGIAFQSGSDTSLLYDTLQRLERETEYADREAKANQYSMGAAALACLLGGFSGSINLVLPYAFSVLAAVVTLLLCYRYYEPIGQSGRSSAGFLGQVGSCLRYLTIPLLLWLLCFYVVGYSLQHVLYEFYQPYLDLLDMQVPALDLFGDQFAAQNGGDETPILSGIVLGLSMLVGVLGARFGMPVFRAIGLTALLLLALAFQTAAIALLGFILHPVVLVLLIGRNFSMAMVRGPLLGAIGPLVDSARRATYLSMQSLAARLCFSLWLYLLSLWLTKDQALDWNSLSSLLRACALAGAVFFVLIGLAALRVTGHNAQKTKKTVA